MYAARVQVCTVYLALGSNDGVPLALRDQKALPSLRRSKVEAQQHEQRRAETFASTTIAQRLSEEVFFSSLPLKKGGRGVANTPAWNISVHRATAVDELPAAKVLSQKADEHTNGGQRGWLEKVFASFFFCSLVVAPV